MLSSGIEKRASESRVQVFLAPREYSSLIQYLFIYAEQDLWLCPKPGTRPGAFDSQRSPAQLPQGGPRSRPGQASVPLCVCVSVCLSLEPHGRAPSHLCRTPSHAVLHLHLAETLPCGLCALFPAHQHDRKDVTAAHSYNSHISNVTVNFMALFLLEDLVRRQLYNS